MPVLVAVGLVLARPAAAEPPPSFWTVVAPPSSVSAARAMEEIIVTPGRIEQRRSEASENVSVLTREDLEKSAPLALDDVLRQVPGFSLFRRSSSLVAHPTTQGVSLRGIAPSGVSRTLVLLDGIPLNDPFGGWVYWSRVPAESLDRVEVVRGGGSGVWGNAALGGVIHLVSRPIEEPGLRLTAQGGTRDTYRIDGAVQRPVGPFHLALDGRVFDTGGYPVVREDQRGPIDVDAASRHAAFRGRIGHRPNETSRWWIDGGYFSERRDNGTPLTGNSTDIGTVAFGAAFDTERAGEWRFDSFAHLQGFESTFSTQDPDRSAERPALDQFDVPSTAVGAGLQWGRTEWEAHELGAGVDVRWVDGETNEDFRLIDDRFTRRRRAGGEQRLLGLWLQDVWRASPITLTASLRGDLWQSADLFRRERSLEDGTVVRVEDFDDRDELAISPRLGLVQQVSDAVVLRGLFYGGFRAPTLNELVRPFRVRNDVTEANASLDPETLLGGEAGAEYSSGRLRTRLTGFWNEIDDPIANVTIGLGEAVIEPCGLIPEGGVCRQRRNLDDSRVRGVETEVDFVPRAPWLATASYLFSDARITGSGEEPALEGKRIAQVPRHQVTLRFSHDAAVPLTAAVQIRYVARQFEDDLNTLSLGDFAVVDLFLARELWRGVDVFFAIENLFDRTIPAGKTADGLVTVGAPFLAHGGVRLKL